MEVVDSPIDSMTLISLHACLWATLNGSSKLDMCVCVGILICVLIVITEEIINLSKGHFMSWWEWLRHENSVKVFVYESLKYSIKSEFKK